MVTRELVHNEQTACLAERSCAKEMKGFPLLRKTASLNKAGHTEVDPCQLKMDK